MAKPPLSKSDRARSADALAAAKKKRDAAPDYSDLVHEFGESGLQRNARGAITGYKYPEVADPEKRRRRDMKVMEMWERHRRVSTEIGAEVNARRQSVTLVDRRTGRERTVPAERAERLARKAGLVERWHRGSSRVAVDFGFPFYGDPHERFYRSHEEADGWHWSARVGGRQGDIVAEGVEPTKSAARDAATRALAALDLPDLPRVPWTPAVYVH